jgi:hypothetical protein
MQEDALEATETVSASRRRRRVRDLAPGWAKQIWHRLP